MMMNRFRDIRENTALMRGATQSPARALGRCAQSPHLTTTDSQRAVFDPGSEQVS